MYQCPGEGTLVNVSRPSTTRRGTTLYFSKPCIASTAFTYCAPVSTWRIGSAARFQASRCTDDSWSKSLDSCPLSKLFECQQRRIACKRRCGGRFSVSIPRAFFETMHLHAKRNTQRASTIAAVVSTPTTPWHDTSSNSLVLSSKWSEPFPRSINY